LPAADSTFDAGFDFPLFIITFHSFRPESVLSSSFSISIINYSLFPTRGSRIISHSLPKASSRNPWFPEIKSPVEMIGRHHEGHRDHKDNVGAQHAVPAHRLEPCDLNYGREFCVRTTPAVSSAAISFSLWPRLCSTSMLCSPSAGAKRRKVGGVSDRRKGDASWRTFPSSG
jgi:hypothetical protein